MKLYPLHEKKKNYNILVYLLPSGRYCFIWPSKGSICLFWRTFTFPIFILCVLLLVYVHNMSTNDQINLMLLSDLTVTKLDTRGIMVLIPFLGSHSISSILKFHVLWICYDDIYCSCAFWWALKRKAKRKKKKRIVTL